MVNATDADSETVRTVAGALRLDQAQRCATPLRPATMPTVLTCRTSVTRVPTGATGVWRLSSLEFAHADGTTGTLWTEVKPQRAATTWPGSRPPTRSTVRRHSGGLWILEYGPAEVFISGTTDAEAVALAPGLTFAPDLTHAATWVG